MAAVVWFGDNFIPVGGTRPTRTRPEPRVSFCTLTLLFALVLAPAARAQLVADGTSAVLSAVTTNVAGDVTVGTNGSFTLLRFTNSAVVNNTGAGYIGLLATAQTNTVRVTYKSRWTATGPLYVGYRGSANQLEVSIGSTMANTAGRVGDGNVDRSDNNVVLVTDFDSLWTNSADLVVGNVGSGNRLTVSNGGAVVSTSGTIGYGNLTDPTTGNNNAVLVTGLNSRWTNSGAMIVGFGGSGNQLVVSNSARVANSISYVGYVSGASNNAALVTGTGSLWTNNGALGIGYRDVGNQLLVRNGGTVASAGATLGDIAGASNNSAVVADANSFWTNSSTLTIGNSGGGNSLVVTNSGRVSAPGVTVGSFPSATNNRVLVDGGSLRVTNAAGNAAFSIFRGTNVLNAGLIEANNLVLNSTAGFFNFNGGTLNVASANVTNNTIFTVGNGVSAAALNFRGSGARTFGNGLRLAANSSVTLTNGSVDVSSLAITNAGGNFTFSGGTLSVSSATVNNGLPFVIGNGSSAATGLLAGNNAHSFNNGLVVSANATLAGNGTVSGGLTVSVGGTLSPGSSVGKLVLNNPPVLQGTVLMEISKNGATLTNDQVQVSGPLTNNGSLTVNDLGPTALAAGDSFTLFSAGSYAGAFTSVTLPPLSVDLTWSNQLSLNGSITVVPKPATQQVVNTNDSGPGSLRDALVSVNTGGTVTFSNNLSGATIPLTNGQLSLDRSVTIDARSLAAGVTVTSGNSNRLFFQATNTTCALLGLTLSGGFSTNGGAIYNNGGSLNLTNCVFAGNATPQTNVAHSGGAIYNNGGALGLDTCTFSGNKSVNGGAIDSIGGSLLMSNCALSGNFGQYFTPGAGSGVIRNSGQLTLTDCTVTGGNSFNAAIFSSGPAALLRCNVSSNGSYYCGGIANSGTMTLTNCTLQGNSGFVGGAVGGIQNNGTLTIDGSTISGSSGSGAIGAIQNVGPLLINRSTISGNSGGSGTIANSSLLTINNSTIGNNLGVGIQLWGGTLTLNNSTISGNTQTNASFVGGINVSAGTVLLTNTIVAGNNSPTNIFGPFSGANNLTAGDPLLAPLGNYGGPTQTMPPLPGSPAIDAGLDSVTNLLATDQRGYPRLVATHVDLGAVEAYSQAVVAAAGDSGPSSLRDVVANVDAGATISFAPALSGQTITLTGGQLTLAKNVTIDASALPGGLNLSGNNSSRVFEVLAGVTASLTGLTIQNGVANGVGTAGNGGGLYNSGTLRLTNCTFTACSAVTAGGAIQDFGPGNLTATACTFSTNNSPRGAINVANAVASFFECTFSGNTATSIGGGALNTSATAANVRLDSCTISGNQATGAAVGGGLRILSGASVTITNCILAGNTCPTVGSENFNGNLIVSGPNLTNGTPLLAPLGNYGGPTQTMPPLPGSPAIDAATNGTGFTTDQRGFARVVGAFADLGAAEFGVPPTATNLSAAESYTEDTALNLIDIVVSDVDSPALTVTLTLSNPGAGSLTTGTSGAVTSTYNAGTGVWTASGAVVDVNVLLAGVSFVPAANYNASFTIATKVEDGVGGAITGTKNMTGIPVNDAPVLDSSKTPTLATVLEDPGAPSGAVGNLVSSLVDFASPPGQMDNMSDVDGGAQLGIAITGVDSNFTAYYSLNGGAAWNPLGAVSAGSARLLAADADNRIYLLPNVNVNGTFPNALTFRAWDQTSGTDAGIASTVDNGGVTAFSTATDAVSITVTPVNDPPFAGSVNIPETYIEDTPLNFVDIQVFDVDNTTLTVMATLLNPNAGSLNTGTSGAVTSTYNPGTGVWTAAGPIPDLNVLLAGLTFTPATNFNGNLTMAVSVSDGNSSFSRTKTLTGTPVNDAPVLDASQSPSLGTVLEDSGQPSGAVGTLVSSLVDFAVPAGQMDNVTEVDAAALLGIAVVATDPNFTCYYSLDGGTTWSAMGAVSASAARLLAANASNRIYVQPNLNVNGTFANAITFRAWDQTSGTDGSLASTVSNGGTTAFSSATDGISLTVTPVNDPPTASNLSTAETYALNTPLNLVDIVVADVDNATLTVTLTLSNPGAGSLSTGTSGTVTSTFTPGTGVWTASGAITDLNTLLAGLTFLPATNFSSNFTIATSVSDGLAPPATGVKAVTSIPANPTPATLTNAAWNNGAFRFTVQGKAAVNYAVEGSTNFSQWTSLVTNAGPAFDFTNPPPVAPRSFFRVRSLP